MTKTRCALTSFCIVLASSVASSCRDTPLAENVDANNKAPIADAGQDQEFAFTGSDVSVTLDASLSADEDGTIVTYRWLSGDVEDGGTARVDIDPADEVSPTLTLGAGTWHFTLFVIDEDDGVSQPDTVTIQVGDGIPREVLECMMSSAPVIADDCKSCVCDTDDMCRDLFLVCDEACWTFYTCVENNCRQYTTPDPGDDDALADCARSNCSDYFNGVGPWIPLEQCVRQEPCGTVCSDSVQGVPF